MGLFSWLTLMSTKAFGVDFSALFEDLPHLSLPFRLDQKGYVLTTDFKAGGNQNKTYSYTFSLSFSITNEDLQNGHLPQLLGFNSRVGEDATTDSKGFKRGGISIPLELSIFQNNQNDEIVLNEKYAKLSAGGAGNSKLFVTIDQIKLTPGNYKIQLKVLESVPELATVPVLFEIWLPGKH